MLADGNLREAEELDSRLSAVKTLKISKALRVLALIAHKNEFSKDAATCWRPCWPPPPSYRAARHDYVLALIALHRHKEAREQIDILITAEPERISTPHDARPASWWAQGDTEAAIALYRRACWRSARTIRSCTCRIGHALKTQGHRDESERAYREAARLRPDFGDAYWSLANLKTYRFDG